MRRFPGKYESVIEKLSDNLYSLEEPNARAALIWIMGEFAERIDNVAEILQVFINTFFDESSTVQLQLLTAVVKLFLKRPQENQNLVQEVLSMVTQQIDNPDIRDRGFIYWRLLSTDPDAAKAVVLADKPLISPESDNLDEALLQELLLNLSSLSSVYHKLPQTLIDGSIKLKNQLQKKLNNNITAKASLLQDKQENTILLDPVFKAPNQQPNDHRDLLDLDFSAPPQPSVQIQTNQNVDLLSDIFTKVQLHPHVQSSAPDKEENKVDLFNVVQSQFSRDVYTPPSVLWLSSQMAKGLEVFGQFLYTPSLSASLTLSNQSLSPFSNFSLQLNKNFFGLSIKDASTFPQCLLPKQIANISITFDFSGVGTLNSTLDSIQVALKNNVDVFYFTVKFPLHFSFKDPLTCCISYDIVF
uniref:AP-1 complex subunit beta-1 (Trinotate prediction) n=1 Tax=Henneguya salminicola TaxID=69463 RepID=A0A6G3ME36_HENSL